MKKNFTKFILIIFLTSITFLYISCSEDVTPSLTEFNTGSLATPVILSIDPPLEALAGITKLTITGSNFSETKENNSVYFNGKAGSVISATSTQLEVISALTIADTVLVKVEVTGAEKFSNILIYKLKAAVSELYPFNQALGEYPYAITVDESENVYVSLNLKGTKKIDSQGNLSDYAPGTTATAFFTSMAFADNSLFGVKKIKGIYRITENTNPAAFVSSSQGITQNVNCINFDKNRGVLWAGANNGTIYRITLTKDVKSFSTSGNINAIKIAHNTIYASASDNNNEVIWKIPIINSDSLGLPELFFNLSSEIDSSVKIKDIQVDEDGYLYIGTDKEADPLYVVHPDLSFEVHYPGVISSAVYNMVWGNDKYLYISNLLNEINTTILKIDMQKLGSN